MPSNKIRVVIDTNIWISFLIGKTITSGFSKLLEDKRFEILSSKELYEELKEVIFRAKFSKYITQPTAEYFLQLFSVATLQIEVVSIVTISTDMDDNFLLALAKNGKAHFLITGDKPHLLKLNMFENTQVITFADFYNKFFL
ncbi:MAG: putative toxin-antitoxin system toxin component, PIN family [Bacteroidales bacterium]